MGGFRCDFAQGLPRQAWQYLINKAKSIKPEMYFVSESLDGGNIAYRAWKGGFDALNENELWAIVEDTDPDSFFSSPASDRARDFLSKILDH